MRPRNIKYSTGEVLKPKGILYVPVKKHDLDQALLKNDHYIMVPGKEYWRRRIMRSTDCEFKDENILPARGIVLRNGYQKVAPEVLKEIKSIEIIPRESIAEPDFLDDEVIVFDFKITMGETLKKNLIKHSNDEKYF